MRASAPPFDVLAIDDDEVTRQGLLTLQLSHPSVIRSMSVAEHPSAVDLSRPPADVVILDHWLSRGREPATPYIEQLVSWGAAVILFTSEEKPGALSAAVAAGARGLCLKGDGLEALVHGIWTAGQGGIAISGPLARAIMEGGHEKDFLTPRERQVLTGLALGMSYAETADRLHLSSKTVEKYVASIFDKYRELTQAPQMNGLRAIREAQLRGDIPEAWRLDPGD